MADMKSAQALLKDLPTNDACMALMELTELVGLLMEHSEFKSDHQFNVLTLFDKTAHSYERKLVREYFTPLELGKFQENRLWSALDHWSRQLATAYFKLFSDFCNAKKGSGVFREQVPLLVARAIRAMKSQVKFVSARYGEIDQTTWTNLMLLYKHAEQLQYLDTPVSLYPGAAANTTVKQEVGHLLIWYDTGLSALSPLLMHVTERLVARYRSTINIRSQLAQHSRVSFDLQRPGEPKRINLEDTTHPYLRFIDMPEMRPRLEDLLQVLKKDIVPDGLNLGGSYSAEVVGEAVQSLLNYLAVHPVRRSVRRAASVNLHVVSGFDNLVERTGALPGFDEALQGLWVTDEISVRGFSTTLSAKGSEGIGIGSLLGIQPERVPHWGAAVVRRLLRKDENHICVGAEILDNRVAGVILNYTSVAGEVLESGQPALWLFSRQDESSGEAQLLMKADTFSLSRSLKIMLNRKEYLLIPIGLQERGLDYDLAKYRFVIQEAASEEAY